MVFALVASIGVVLAAYYALRLFIRSMHNRKPAGVESKEIGLRDGLVVGAPGRLHRGAGALSAAALDRRSVGQGADDRQQAVATSRRDEVRANELPGPRDRLRRALAGHRADRGHLRRAAGRAAGCRAGSCPRRRSASLGITAGLCIWQWGENTRPVEGALRLDDLALAAALIAILAGVGGPVLLAMREPAAEDAGQGEYYALLLGSVLGMVILVAGAEPGQLFLGLELLSIPLYVLCASAIRASTRWSPA